MRRLASAFLAALALSSAIAASAGTSDVLTCISDLNRALASANPEGRTFDITAKVVAANSRITSTIIVKDDTASVVLHNAVLEKWEKPFACGEILHLTGVVVVPRGMNPQPHIATAEWLAVEEPDPPRDVTIAEILGGGLNLQLVRVEGTVMDARRDDVDPKFAFLILHDENEIVYVTIHFDPKRADLERLVGARVSVTGTCACQSPRPQTGWNVSCGDFANIVIKQAPGNPFDAPDLFSGDGKSLHVIHFDWMSLRKASGRILASWGGSSALLKTGSGKIVRINFAEQTPPACGATIEAAGRPETDLFHLNLSRGTWRACDVKTEPDPPPVHVNAKDMLRDGHGETRIKYMLYGRPITIRGVVRSLHKPGDASGRMTLDDSSFPVTVEAGGASKAISRIAVGSKVEVTGTCVLDADTWRPQSPFPRIKGFFVVPRNDSDITVLSGPPWWTTSRLATVIGVLLLGISAMLVWNRSLARIAERRGRELFNAEIEKVGGDLRLEERTRLAVELHDSISQSLASVSMEMATASLYPKGADPEMTRHLAIAQRTLNACREEIRNCIWDLRRDTLGMSDMTEAIRLALLPHVKNAAMNVRFNVPRSRLTDKTAHDILQIVRELVVNAIRHGGASEVRVAGSLEGSTLKFSVSDNGRGFDNETALGVDDGHFGLQGIRERAGRMGGRLVIDSRPGGGCKATVHITLPQADRDDIA
ncbi:MAG: ATP-binding protein [Kiritimatiellae bacterium]|nr:ATP-binding protein [Kiritimatiellia bacterium]MBQ3340906.1 ATP-binding protein [Kiritimatiellia bacterium]